MISVINIWMIVLVVEWIERILVEQISQYQQQMGNCLGPDSRRPPGNLPTSNKFTELELSLIQMMYDNLAKRCRGGSLTRQTFDLFFNSSGLIGQIIFLRFDSRKNGTISFEEFLQAFELMCKGSLRERANVLFDIYDVEQSGGVTYSELIKILFSYPLQELNKMFIEQKFLQYIGPAELSLFFGPGKKVEDKNTLVEEDSQNVEESKRKSVKYFKSMAVISPISPDLTKNTSKKTDNLQEQLRKRSQDAYYASVSTKNIGSTLFSVQKLRHLRPKLKIRSNIATMTKRYAKFLFQQAGLNKDKDEFSKQLFYDLIMDRHALFNVYMSGFHTYIWQEIEGQVQFLNISPWVEGEVTESYMTKTQNVYLKYIRTTVFVLPYKKSTLPRQIISLEGLSVSGVTKKGEYGICFRHRDGLYPAKQYYFNSQQIQQEWLKQLEDFKESTIYDNYIKLERIGGGNFSQVFRGRDKKSGGSVAIKIIQNFKFSNAEKEVIKRECTILAQCRHPNIIKFIGQFKTKSHWYILTELMEEGDLFGYTKKKQFLEEYEAAIVFKQLVDTILYVNRELGVIHRDLKPENVMIIRNKEKDTISKIKLIDFGFGIFKDKLDQLPAKEKYAGTPGFIPPQIYKMEDFDDKADTFSLGIILYFMLSGSLPFQGNFEQEVRDLTLKCEPMLDNLHWSNVSDKAKDLVRKMLTFKEQRITTNQVLKHGWMQNIEELKQLQGRNKKGSW